MIWIVYAIASLQSVGTSRRGMKGDRYIKQTRRLFTAKRVIGDKLDMRRYIGLACTSSDEPQKCKQYHFEELNRIMSEQEIRDQMDEWSTEDIVDDEPYTLGSSLSDISPIVEKKRFYQFLTNALTGYSKLIDVTTSVITAPVQIFILNIMLTAHKVGLLNIESPIISIVPVIRNLAKEVMNGLALGNLAYKASIMTENTVNSCKEDIKTILELLKSDELNLGITKEEGGCIIVVDPEPFHLTTHYADEFATNCISENQLLTTSNCRENKFIKALKSVNNMASQLQLKVEDLKFAKTDLERRRDKQNEVFGLRVFSSLCLIYAIITGAASFVISIPFHIVMLFAVIVSDRLSDDSESSTIYLILSGIVNFLVMTAMLGTPALWLIDKAVTRQDKLLYEISDLQCKELLEKDKNK